MKLHLYESTVPQWADDLGQQVYDTLRDAELYGDVNVEPGNTEHDCTISVEVMNGDWKHEHLRTDDVVIDLLDNPGVTYGRKIKETPVGDSDSDTYSSIHTYAVIKLRSSAVESCTESLGVFDYYGLYIEPENEDGFIVYNPEKAVIQRIAQDIRNEWFAIREDSVDEIKEFIYNDYVSNEFIDRDEIDYTKFTDDGSIYLFNNKQIKIIKSFD